MTRSQAICMTTATAKVQNHRGFTCSPWTGTPLVSNSHFWVMAISWRFFPGSSLGTDTLPGGATVSLRWRCGVGLKDLNLFREAFERVLIFSGWQRTGVIHEYGIAWFAGPSRGSTHGQGCSSGEPKLLTLTTFVEPSELKRDGGRGHAHTIICTHPFVDSKWFKPSYNNRLTRGYPHGHIIIFHLIVMHVTSFGLLQIDRLFVKSICHMLRREKHLRKHWTPGCSRHLPSWVLASALEDAISGFSENDNLQ